MNEVIICEPRTDCMDAHALRWYCMRGHAMSEDGKPAAPGVCPLTKCDRLGANREPDAAPETTQGRAELGLHGE